MFCNEAKIEPDQAAAIDFVTKRLYVVTLKRQSEIKRIKTHSAKLHRWAETVQTGGMSTQEVQDAWDFVAWDIGIMDGILMDISTQRALLSTKLIAAAQKSSRWRYCLVRSGHKLLC